ncbi:MAG: HPF/RaiA family ribosome-associated protein [Thiotrichales bacterium]
MHIDLQANHLTLTEPLRKHIDLRLRMIMARVGHRITRVIVRLSDVNGPKGGLDKVCKIEIRLSGMPEIVVEDVQSDMYLAFDRAVARAGRTLARRVALPVTRRRSHAAGATPESGRP